MRVAYFDCIGGISGDMALGALIDAGADAGLLEAGLHGLGLPAWSLSVGRTQKHGISAARVEVLVGGRDAGDAWLTRVPPRDNPRGGHRPPAGRVRVRRKSDEPAADVEATAGAPAEPTPESGISMAGETMAEVEAIIGATRLPGEVVSTAVAVYRALAEAEARVHGATLDTVHFHEVGAIDSIVDVVGTVYALHLLGVEAVQCSPLPCGTGFVRCAHGLMPNPPPATAELLRGCPLRPEEVQGELVTPTGAALARTLATRFGTIPPMSVEQIGYGAGKRNFPFPNLTRVLIGELLESPSYPAASAGDVVLIETNLDDQTGQVTAAAIEALLAAGALDVWATPILMKKGRPGCTLSALCRPEAQRSIEALIFAETTTLGVRSSVWHRHCLDREWRPVSTPWGKVRVKLGILNGVVMTVMPEFEECRALASQHAIPVKQVQAAAAAAAWSAQDSART